VLDVLVDAGVADRADSPCSVGMRASAIAPMLLFVLAPHSIKAAMEISARSALSEKTAARRSCAIAPFVLLA